MNIADFLANISQGGLARTSHFQVLITPPTQLGLATTLSYRCSQIIFPGRQIDDVQPISYGIPRAFGYRATHDEVRATFILSKSFAERQIMLAWQDKVVNTYRTTNGAPTAGMFDIGYYDDYRGQIEISQYDDTGAKTYTCKLLDAWPKFVGSIQGDWNGGDQFHTLDVGFAYWVFLDGNGIVHEVDEDGNSIAHGVA